MSSEAMRSVRPPHPTTNDAQVAITKLLIARRAFFIGDCEQRNRHADQQSQRFGGSAVKSDTQQMREWHKLGRFLARWAMPAVPRTSRRRALHPHFPAWANRGREFPASTSRWLVRTRLTRRGTP
jgi:hypothetical protein